MEWQKQKTGLLAAILLLVSVIWHAPAFAATAPELASLGRISSDQIRFVSALDVDPEGNLYVADSLSHVVYRLNKFGELEKAYSGAFLSSAAMAVDYARSRLYVGDRTIVRVVDLGSGTVVGALGSGDGEFGYADMIKVDADGNVYVVDQSVLTIRKFNADFKEYAYSIGKKGTTVSTLLSAWALAVDSASQEVYVADVQTYGRNPAKVVVYSTTGTYKRNLPMTTAFGSPSLAWFGGIAFEDPDPLKVEGNERSYFLDTMLGQIRVMPAPAIAGSLLQIYGTMGNEVGQLAMPRAVAYDALTKRLFVSSDGGRIEVFGIDGAMNPAPPVTNTKPGFPELSSPIGGVEVAAKKPLLQIMNAVDVDGDALTYQVQVYSGDTLVADYVGLPEGDGTTFVQVDVTLPENAQVAWRAQAYDGKEASGWTGLETFYVNEEQEAPSAPVITMPIDGALVDGGSVFAWTGSTDPDPYEVIQYQIEIATDPTFVQSVVKSVLGSSLSVTLGEIEEYAALEDGAAYYWRPLAVDESGLVAYGEFGAFVYDAAILTVDANMPGTQVYLGGNFGYYGAYAGEVPLELRDFAPGVTTVVLVRSGFEPLLQQVVVGERENVAVVGELVPALTPEDLKARPVEVGGTKVSLSGDAVPYLVDLNGDGLQDLVTGELSGEIKVANGSESVDGELIFETAVAIDGLPLLPGATPVVVDWNNDRLSDFIIGAEDGTVHLYLAAFDNGEIVYSGSVLVTVEGPLVVSGAAVPVVYDVDADGDKDLLVGATDGTVSLLANVGTDSTPELAAPSVLFRISSPVSPFVVDWDGDREGELLLAADEHIYVYERVGANYKPVAVLSVADELISGNSGKSTSGTYSLGNRLRVFSVDLDGKAGKDVLVGNSAGEIRFVRSFGSEPVASYKLALVDKITQIEEILVETDSSAVRVAIETSDYKAASKEAQVLLNGLFPGDPGYVEVEQLLQLLK